MAKKYCVYSNEYFDENLLNKEHIIPKKIGGQLDFSILVSKELNSELGSLIDAPFVEDTFIKLLCKDYNFKSHSKKNTPAFKDAIIQETNELVDITFENNKMIFHKKWRENSPSWTKTLEQCKAKTIKLNATLSMDVYLKFMAKLLLASSYFLFGDAFIQYGFHEDLRSIMNSNDIKKIISNNNLKTRILAAEENPDAFMHIVSSDLKAFKNYHVIWSSHYKNAIVVGISLFGNKMLSASCMIADKPEYFNTEGKGTVFLKELSSNSQRRLIKTTQEDIILKLTKTFFPEMQIEKILIKNEI